MFKTILLVSFGGAAALVRAEPLSYSSALEIATRSSPDITVQTTSVAAARSAAVAAGRVNPACSLSSAEIQAHVLKRGSGIGGQPGESRPRTEPLRTSCSYFRATHEFHSVWPCP